MPTNDIAFTVITPSPKKAPTTSTHKKSSGSTYQVSDELRQLEERCKKKSAETKRALEQFQKAHAATDRCVEIIRELTASQRRRLICNDSTPMPVVSSSEEAAKTRKGEEATNQDGPENPKDSTEIMATLEASMERCQKIIDELKESPYFASR